MSTVETISLGFTERNGDWTERCDALKEFTGLFGKYKDKIARAMAPESEVAILYNLDSIFIEGLVSLGTSGSCLIRKQNRFYKDSLALMGAYKLCMKNLIQPDFINKERAQNGELEKYKLLIIPYGVSVTSELGAAIETYVKGGGRIISDGMLGYFTDEAWGAEICPAGGLDQVFGLDVKSDYQVINEENLKDAGHVYEKIAKVTAEHMEVKQGAGVFASFENGRPAAVSNGYGKGKTAYVGTLFFANAMWNYSEHTNTFFGKLMEEVEYRPAAQISCPGGELVEVRMLYGEQEAFLFVINHENKSAEFELAFPCSGYTELRDITADKTSVLTNDRAVLRLSLEAEEVKVYMLERR